MNPPILMWGKKIRGLIIELMLEINNRNAYLFYHIIRIQIIIREARC